MTKPGSIRHRYRILPDWDKFPKHTDTLVDIPRDTTRLRFARDRNSQRGLREFTTLKELVIFSPNAAAIEEIAHLEQLTFLNIDATRATDLSPLVRCSSLRNLSIMGATQITTLDWVRDLPALDSLLLENIKKVTDLSPLASLSTVKALGIEGSMWTRQKVDTFIPLAGLTQLEALFITNCKPKADGLAPLHALSQLRYLEAPGFYPEKEFLALEAALPELSCSWFERIREHGTIKAAIDASVEASLGKSAP